MTRNLVVHFKRLTYLIVPSPEALALAGRRVLLHESADGRVEIHCQGTLLPYSVLDKQPLVSPGEVVENKRLGAVLTLIQTGQQERDRRRLASKKLTLRQKDRIREARSKGGLADTIPAAADASPTPPSSPDRLARAFATTLPLGRGGGPVAAFMDNFLAEQKAKRKKSNDLSNQRKRDRELLAAKARPPAPSLFHGGTVFHDRGDISTWEK